MFFYFKILQLGSFNAPLKVLVLLWLSHVLPGGGGVVLISSLTEAH